MRIEISPQDLRLRALVLRKTAADLAQTVTELQGALALVGQTSSTLRSLDGVIDGVVGRALDLEERAVFIEEYQPIEDLAVTDECSVDEPAESHPVETVVQGLINYGAGRANGIAMFASEAFNMTPVPFALQHFDVIEPVDIEVPPVFPAGEHAEVLHGIGTAEGYLGLTALEIALGRPSGVTGIGSVVLQTLAAVDELARRLLPIDGYHDVIIFGAPHPLVVDQVDGQLAIDHRVVSTLISKSPAYGGGPVRLIAASSGIAIAQDLANKLGVDVLATGDIPWIQPGGAAALEPAAPTSIDFLAFAPGKG